MNKDKINVFDNSETLAQGFTSFLLKLLDVYPHINISLSGGSTPKDLFDYWAANCTDSIDWKRISFFWGDERCVPPENEMNNYRMAKEHLFDKVDAIRASNIYRIHGENEPNEEALWYSKMLQSKLLQRKETPCFELIILGLGNDGHTVSIFPHQMELWNSSQTCVVATHPESGMERVSLSGGVVNNAQHVVFLVTGTSKAEKVRDIIKDRAAFQDIYPAAKVQPKYGYLYWFLDKEAASLL